MNRSGSLFKQFHGVLRKVETARKGIREERPVSFERSPHGPAVVGSECVWLHERVVKAALADRQLSKVILLSLY
jgi:hypothetical protein